jgi:hypothetical protein
MKIRKILIVLAFIIFVLAATWSGERLAANVPIKPWDFRTFEFTGYVHLHLAWNQIGMEVWVRQRGQLLTTLTAKLMGSPATAFASGEYDCHIQNFVAAPGGMVSVTFDNLPGFQGSAQPPSPQLTAQATIGGLLSITAPLRDAQIDLSKPGFPPVLNVAWRGGNPPYEVWVYPWPDAVKGNMFHQQGVAGTSLSVPFSALLPGKQYRVAVVAKMAEFSFSSSVSQGSTFPLMQDDVVTFRTK